MPFLADECTSGSIVRALLAAGFDVARAADLCQSEPDANVLDLAYRLQRLLITEDKDFGELTVRLQRPNHGVIIVFLPNMASAERAERVLGVIRDSNNRFAGRLTVIEPNRIRQRLIAGPTEQRP